MYFSNRKHFARTKNLYVLCYALNVCFRALGDQEAKNEFNELFDDLVVDVVDSMTKYTEVVKHLEMLLDLEKETLLIKKKVASFSLDYDDNLVILILTHKHQDSSISKICNL